MNKLYIVVPVVLTLGFSGLYYTHITDAKAEAVAIRLAEEKADAEAGAKKAEAERQAREDAERRTAERLAEEKRKEEERAAKWAAAGKQIADETASFIDQAAKNAAEVTALEAKLASLRKEKEAAGRVVFETASAVEAARVKKRNAELEIQRLVEMVARRGGTSLAPVGAIP
jgi:hypothetical protein